jgi:alpha-beta hydrolase superfamily lysophospholipase
MSRDMVLVHGAWLASNSWEHFARYFTDRGYDVIAPEWPRKHDDVADQRADPDELAGLGVKEIVDHYDGIVRAMSEPPVLIGHSFGGLFVEMLLDRGLGAAGVALDPAAPKGVMRVEPSQLKAAGPALNHPLHRHGVVPLDFEEFRYAFVNTWDEDAARDAYDRYAVPETARILFQGGLANFALHPATRIDFHKADRAPLLITAGEKDNTVPPGVSKAAFHKYEHSGATTDFVEFEGRSHLLVAGPGWEEVAGYVAGWLDRVLAEVPAVSEVE